MGRGDDVFESGFGAPRARLDSRFFASAYVAIFGSEPIMVPSNVITHRPFRNRNETVDFSFAVIIRPISAAA